MRLREVRARSTAYAKTEISLPMAVAKIVNTATPSTSRWTGLALGAQAPVTREGARERASRRRAEDPHRGARPLAPSTRRREDAARLEPVVAALRDTEPLADLPGREQALFLYIGVHPAEGVRVVPRQVARDAVRRGAVLGLHLHPSPAPAAA